MNAFRPLERIIEILNNKNIKSCHCQQCKKEVDFCAGRYTCKVCGYIGSPAMVMHTCPEKLSCDIDDEVECLHGTKVCPVCDDGDLQDGYAFVRAIRRVISESK